MAPPSTTLRPAGTPSLAEWASRFQCAVLKTCQIPFRSGLRSGVRGPLYAEAIAAADRVAPRCARVTRVAVIVINTDRPATPATVTIGFFMLTRESLPQPRYPGNAAPTRPFRRVRAHIRRGSFPSAAGTGRVAVMFRPPHADDPCPGGFNARGRTDDSPRDRCCW